ncbi:TonB-dependent receptor domain-containing protein [Novosphingobium sp.]|uniref:TonB-dependent receptor domain-containing protein n=1 Tax=Novosphingobium sp. TaxID=1874826 RepID=UPI003BA851BA
MIGKHMQMVSTAAMALALLPGAAFAQTREPAVSTAADSADGIPEIVVTARKRAESQQTVPVAVTAVSPAMLEARAATNIVDLRGQVPNLLIEQGYGNTGNAIIFIRGIGVQENERFIDPAVGVVVDGVFLGSSRGALVNTFDFESVEVLRGPQGTLFGKNTTGGVINIRHTTPQGEFGGKFEVTLGNYNRQDYKGVLNVPLMGDRLAFRISAAKIGDDYYVRSLQAGRVKGVDILDVTASLKAKFGDNVDALLSYQHQYDKSLTPATINLSGTGNAVNPGGEIVCTILKFCGPFDGGDTFGGTPYYNHDEQNNVTLEVNWSTPIGQLTSVSSYRKATNRQPSDSDSVPANVFGVRRDYDFNQKSSELRLNSQIGSHVNLTVGGFYFADDIALRQDIVDLIPFFGGPAGAQVQIRTAQQRSAWALFAETDIKLPYNLNLTAGGRYSSEHKNFQGAGFTYIPGLGALPIASASDSRTWTDFSPKAGLNWQATPRIMVYYSFSKGFRSGGFNGRTFTPAAIGPYNPESVHQHEIGFKSDLFGRHLRLNIAAFITGYSNKQEQVIQADPVQGTSTVTANAATAHMRGIEGEFTWRAPLRGLTLSGNLSYLDAHYADFCADLDGPLITNPAERACAAPTLVSGGILQPTNNSALKLVRAPSWSFGINGDYTASVGPGELHAFASYSRSASFYQDLRNDPRGLFPALGKLDASLGYNWELSGKRRLGITAFVRNLTNDRAISGFAVAPPYVAFGIRTEPRTFGVTLSGGF